MQAFNRQSQSLNNGFSSQQMNPQKPLRRNPIQWWFSLTSVPDPAADASFLERERVRRARLVSIISFLMLALFILLIPFDLLALKLGSYSTIIGTTLIVPVAIAVILLNRSRKVIAAGIVIVVFFELALTMTIISATPFGFVDTSVYQIFVVVELFAVTILPPESVFIVATCNIAIIIGTLLSVPTTPDLGFFRQHQFARVVTNPVVVQVLVAGISYLWVRGTFRAIARADRAEVIASLEHQIAQQIAQVAEEKRQLEASINQIVQSHIDAMNNRIVTKIPFSKDTKVLWPLINVVDSQQKRLRNAHYTEYELQRLKKAIAAYTDFVYNKGLDRQQQWPQTKTDLDMLLYAIREWGSFAGHTPAAGSLSEKRRRATQPFKQYSVEKRSW